MRVDNDDAQALETVTLGWAKAVGLMLVLLTAAGGLFRYAVPYVLDRFGFLEAMAAAAVSLVLLAYLAVGLFRLLRRLTGRKSPNQGSPS